MEIKSFCFSTRKREHLFSEIKSNSSLRAKGKERDVIPTGLSTAFSIILLWFLGTWEEGVCVGGLEGGVRGVGVAERKGELVWEGRSVPLELA